MDSLLWVLPKEPPKEPGYLAAVLLVGVVPLPILVSIGIAVTVAVGITVAIVIPIPIAPWSLKVVEEQGHIFNGF